jgi:hypothetical protein
MTFYDTLFDILHILVQLQLIIFVGNILTNFKAIIFYLSFITSLIIIISFLITVIKNLYNT